MSHYSSKLYVCQGLLLCFAHMQRGPETNHHARARTPGVNTEHTLLLSSTLTLPFFFCLGSRREGPIPISHQFTVGADHLRLHSVDEPSYESWSSYNRFQYSKQQSQVCFLESKAPSNHFHVNVHRIALHICDEAWITTEALQPFKRSFCIDVQRPPPSSLKINKSKKRNSKQRQKTSQLFIYWFHSEFGPVHVYNVFIIHWVFRNILIALKQSWILLVYMYIHGLTLFRSNAFLYWHNLGVVPQPDMPPRFCHG